MQYYVTHRDFERVNKDKPITTKQLEDLKIKIMRQFEDFQEELANIYGNKK